VQALDLRIQQIAGFREVWDRGTAVPVLVFQHCDHAMTHRIAGPKSQYMLQYRDGREVVCLIVKLRLLLQSRQVIGRELQRIVKGRKRILSSFHPRVGDALQHPKLRIRGKFFDIRAGQVQGVLIVIGVQGRCNGTHLILRESDVSAEKKNREDRK